MTAEMGIGSQRENKSTFNSSTKVSCNTIITQKQWQLCRILLGAPFLSTMSRRSSQKVEILMTYYSYRLSVQMQKHNAQIIWYREVMIDAENAQNACTDTQMSHSK